ncbi:hypothetical protein PHMEG_00023381 [Phytophthora megakarya]|uniref:Tf2-1-like SH3-like domain-containing protein n=1 Tax=Phytophthora megakarya TaxID=4795 RepID=A0A225VIV0_9STRA|nr:hypothetical protein PHMEG_00023381 [Phytophthora megakarya]
MDASDFAIGGYLYQLDDEGQERVIAYGGHITNRYLGDYLQAVGMAPFVADLGYLPLSVSDLEIPPRDGPKAASRFVEAQQAILTECQDALNQAQQRMKLYHDRNRPTATYQVGDEVLLDTSNLALHHVGSENKRSLAAKFVGPYPVIAVMTPDTYKLGIPPGPQLHDEFHVSRLRPYTPDDSATRDNRVP